MKKVGVVIVNYNSARLTIECIESLKKCANYDIMQIIVVDNCSTDDSYKKLQEKLSQEIILVKSAYNGGFSYGNNIGIKIAIERCCEYILLINEDTEVEPNFLVHLLNEIEQDVQIGIVAPKILFYNTPQKIWSKGGLINWMYAGENGSLNKKDDGDDRNVMAQFLTGCCILFRKELVDNVGFLSEKYFMYYEDVEFSDRVTNAGYHLVCVPKSVIYHKVGMASGGDKSPFMLEWSERGHKIFLHEKRRENKWIYIIEFIVFVRNLIRIIYFGIFKDKEQANAIWNGMVK